MESRLASSPSAVLNEYLTFTLGAEEYGVDIDKVLEIRGYDHVTRVPHSPAYVKGVINLRGSIVPVVDLRMKFNIGKAVYDDTTVMMILKLDGRIVGSVVDAVSDVIHLNNKDLAPPPSLGAAFDPRFLRGLAKLEQRLLIVVDIDRLFTGDEMSFAGEPAIETA